jgi:hypothetical protein
MIEKVFDLKIDYNLSLDEMISAGKYELVNNNISPGSCPIPGDMIGRVEKLKSRVFHFNRLLYNKSVFKKMKKEGFRPATAHEIIAFGAQVPDLQRNFPIIGLGSIWMSDERFSNVMSLSEFDSKRSLGIISDWGGGWLNHFRFLGVYI